MVFMVSVFSFLHWSTSSIISVFCFVHFKNSTIKIYMNVFEGYTCKYRQRMCSVLHVSLVLLNEAECKNKYSIFFNKMYVCVKIFKREYVFVSKSLYFKCDWYDKPTVGI